MPDQIEFLKRKRGEVGFSGLDTHGRPSPSAGAAPTQASYSAPAPAASGEFAGMTPEQIEFMRRRRGEIGFSGLDTHGRPSPSANAPRLSSLDAQDSPFGVLSAGLLVFFTCSAVTFAILRSRRN